MLHVATINERRGYEFEKEQGRAYGRVLRQESQRRNNVIIIPQNKSK